MQAPSEESRPGIATTSRRRRRVSSSRASARARPMWPWLARAAYDAVSTPSPSARTRKSVTSSTEGVDEHDQAGARPDRRQHVLDGRRAEQPDGALGGLLDRLEQRVGRLVGEPVGVLDDHDLPASADRGERRRAHQLAHLVDADRELLGAGDADVGVGADRDLVAGVALTAAALLALQRGREGDRGVGAARAGRPGEQPGVGHLARHGALERARSPGPGRPGRPRPSSRTPRPLRHAGRARRPRSSRRRRGRRARGSGRDRPRPARRNASRTRWWNSSDSPSMRSRSSNLVRPVLGSRSSSTVRCGRRSSVAQRATHSSSSTSRERPAPW